MDEGSGLVRHGLPLRTGKWKRGNVVEMIARKSKLKLAVTLLLFLAAFAKPGAGLMFAQDAKSRVPSWKSSNAALESNHVERGASSTVSAEPEEHGLTQGAAEITRLFGLPISNSMIVTWVTALGLIVFAASGADAATITGTVTGPDGAQCGIAKTAETTPIPATCPANSHPTR